MPKADEINGDDDHHHADRRHYRRKKTKSQHTILSPTTVVMGEVAAVIADGHRANGSAAPEDRPSSDLNGHRHVHGSGSAPTHDQKSRLKLELKRELEAELAATLAEQISRTLRAEVAQQLRVELKAEILAELKAELAAETGPEKKGDKSESSVGGQEPAAAYFDGDEGEERELHESIWEASMIIGTDMLGVASSVFLSCCLCVNALGQGLFMWIVYSTGLSQAQFDHDVVSALREWRRTVAHDVQYYNRLTKKSLSMRVCDGDPGLEMAAGQASQFEVVDQYLSSGSGGRGGGDDNDEHGMLGVLMSGFACFMWCCTIARELQDAWFFVLSIFSVPWSRRPTHMVRNADGKVRVQRLSYTRVVLLILTTMVRLVIALMLLIYGTLFLAYEVDLGDLLLNAVALEFVINIDELLFEVFAPTRAKLVLSSFAPFQLPKPPTWRGLDARKPLTALFVAVCLIITMSEIVMPQREILAGVWDAVCAGERDFVYAVDGAGTPTWAFVSEERLVIDTLGYAASGNRYSYSYNREWPQMEEEDDPIPGYTLREMSHQGVQYEMSYAESVIDFVLQGKYNGNCSLETCYNVDEGADGAPKLPSDAPGCCVALQTRTDRVIGGRFSVSTRKTESVADASLLWNPVCFDVLDKPVGTLYYNLLAGAFLDAASEDSCNGGQGCPAATPFCKNETCLAVSCSTVVPYCLESSLAGIRARQSCPNTCGCSMPLSAQILTDPEMGCPSQCKQSAVMHLDLQRAPCVDMELSDPRFQEYLDQWAHQANEWPADFRTGGELHANMVSKFGCEYVLMRQAPDDYTATGPIDRFVQHGLIPPGSNLCVANHNLYPIKPLSFYCPVSCGCRRGDQDCPYTCPERTANESALLSGFLAPPSSGRTPNNWATVQMYFYTLATTGWGHWIDDGFGQSYDWFGIGELFGIR